MRKLLITLALAGALSVPSAVFAEASLYGSLRIGVESKDSNINVDNTSSRWGIMGSHEAGEGLTSVYRFEASVNDDAELGGRLNYVGLSGGFGSLTVGRINSAGYGAVGPILDNSWYYGAAGVASRLGNAVSYAFRNDLMTMQIDASYESPDAVATEDITDGLTVAQQNAIRNAKNLQQVEFGLTVNVGEIGKVGFAYVDDSYELDSSGMLTQADGTTLVTGASSWQTKTTVAAAQISVTGLTVSIGSARNKYTNTSGSDAAGDGNLAVKPDEKTTFFGVRGGLGDTGVGYVLQWRDVKPTDTNPWLISLTKGLGDNASLVLEHANNDTNPNATQVGLIVNF